jgi:hypothetical protein
MLQGIETDTIRSQNPPGFNISEMYTDQGVQVDTMQPNNPPEFNTETTTNAIDTHATEKGNENGYQVMADQDMADQGMEDQEMADQEMADQEMADQDTVDQEMANLGMELQDQETHHQEGRHQCAVDLYYITQYKAIEQESPLLPEYLDLAHALQNLGINMVQQLVKASITDPPILSKDACIVLCNIQRNFNHFNPSQRCPYEEISSR